MPIERAEGEFNGTKIELTLYLLYVAISALIVLPKDDEHYCLCSIIVWFYGLM